MPVSKRLRQGLERHQADDEETPLREAPRRRESARLGDVGPEDARACVLRPRSRRSPTGATMAASPFIWATRRTGTTRMIGDGVDLEIGAACRPLEGPARRAPNLQRDDRWECAEGGGGARPTEEGEKTGPSALRERYDGVRTGRFHYVNRVIPVRSQRRGQEFDPPAVHQIPSFLPHAVAACDFTSHSKIGRGELTRGVSSRSMLRPVW